MAKAAAARPNDPLTRGELDDDRRRPHPHAGRSQPRIPAAKVTMAALDSRLVAGARPHRHRRLFTQAAKTAGLAPPSRFGTEAVARLLGLRTNHPAALEQLELSPGEPANHAEAAYSAARILQLGECDPAGLQALAELLRSARADAVAEERPDDGRALHRLPVRLGRRERVPGIAVRPTGPRRLRLLRLRLARLQDRAVRRRRHPRRHAAGPDDLSR